MTRERTRTYRADLPSGRWFGVRAERDHSDRDGGLRVAVGTGFLASGNWNVVGPSMPPREADWLALHIFERMLPHAKAEDARREERLA